MPHKYPLNLPLNGQQKMVLERVVKAGKNGIDGEQLFQYVFGAHPDGGPLTGIKVLPVLVWQVNKKLRVLGKRIKGGQGGRSVHATYRLVDL
jgi:hypothetical protein